MNKESLQIAFENWVNNPRSTDAQLMKLYREAEKINEVVFLKQLIVENLSR